MKKWLTYSILFIYLVLGLKTNADAQDATLIFTELIPQNNLINPAVNYDSTIIVITPSAKFLIGNNTYGLKNSFSWNASREYKNWDLEYLTENARTENFANAVINYSIFYIERKLSHGFTSSFSLNHKSSFNFLFPEQLFDLTEGNANYETESIRNYAVNGLSFNGISYTEYSFGLSKILGSTFRAGMHLKLLNGQYLMRTKYFDASLYTPKNMEETTLAADIRYLQSSPVINNDPGNEYFFDVGNYPKQYYLFNNFFKNMGAAIDLGFVYSPNPKTEIQGAITDFGFITWNTNQADVTYNGSYTFKGFDLSPSDGSTEDFGENITAVADSIKSIFSPQIDDVSAFSTGVNTKFILGAKRKINSKYSLFGLLSMHNYPNYRNYNMTAGTIFNPVNNLAVSITTSYKNSHLGNLGAGMRYGTGKFQFFISTGNLEFLILKSSRSANLTFGVNFHIY